MTAKNFNKVVDDAIKFAKSNYHEYLLIDHLAWALLDDPDIQALLTNLGAQHTAIKAGITNHLANNQIVTLLPSQYTQDMPVQTKHVERVLKRAMTQKLLSGSKEVTTDCILMSILCENKNAALTVLDHHGVTREVVVKYLKKGAKRSGKRGASTLEEYCRNLNESCKDGKVDPVIGRETEVQDMIEVIARRKKNNVILVGKEGVGKTALAEGLAKQIVDGLVPAVISDKVVYSLDIGSMLAGTKFRGEFEERLKNVLGEIKEMGNVILFIDEIHMIMGAGASGGGTIDASNMMKPMLANGEMTCIGATTYDEFSSHLDKDRALMRRFQKIDVNPPSVADTKRILQGVAKYYEEFHGVTYEPGALDSCVDLSERYIKARFLPDKAIDVMDFAGAKAKLDGLPTVSTDTVLGRVAKLSKMPLEMIDLKENDVLRTLDTKVKNKVFGQDSAVDLIVEAVGLSKSGLREGNKPIGSFLFVGPTGTGKTFLCKTLAANMGIQLVKFDMSEYQESHSVSRLVGAPPGYVGHGEGEAGSGQLISEIEKNPNCILLLDEIEKAHPQVLTVLLQVMEDGILTSSTGKKVDFSNVVLIMTSNLGAADAEKRSIGINNDVGESRIMEAVKRQLTPEFRNRLDHIVEFKKLTMHEMTAIVENAIVGLNETVATKNIVVTVNIAARKWLAENGYEPSMGARPFKRLFDNEVKKPISREILFGGLMGGGTVTISVSNDKLAFEVYPAPVFQPESQPAV